MKHSFKTSCQLLILLALQFSPFFVNSQTTFEKIYSATVDQEGVDVLHTIDGGYIVAGSTNTKITTDRDIRVWKTDNMGDTIWTKNYGGSKPDYPNGILEITDSTYFIIGYSQSFGAGDVNIYLLKINSRKGDTLWTKVYGGAGYDEGSEIIATKDGNYMIVAHSNSLNLSDYNIQLIKIRPDGSVMWTKYYGGSTTYESARSLRLCSDGGFIIVGRTAPSEFGTSQIYVVRTDSTGGTLWTKSYGGPNSYEGKYVITNSDKSFTICADDSSGARDSDVKVFKIDSAGTKIWDKTYGGSYKDISKMIQHTFDGGYIVSSISRSFNVMITPDMWLIKLDANGDMTWNKFYGGPKHEHCYAVRQTADSGFVTVGHSTSFSANAEFMFVKTDKNGNSQSISGVNEFAVNNVFNIYPNPSDGFVTIDLTSLKETASILRISNSLGQEVFSESINPLNATGNRTIDMKDKAPGIYFLTVQSANYSASQKLILNK